MQAAIDLRPIRDDDRELLYEIYASTREEELAQAPWEPAEVEQFLRLQFAAQHADYHRRFPQARFDIIELDGKPIGRLYVDRREETIHVIDIALLPAHRSAGIGGALLRAILEEAAASGRAASIYVMQGNRALRLYERLGFRQVDDAGVYLLLEWRGDGEARE